MKQKLGRNAKQYNKLFKSKVSLEIMDKVYTNIDLARDYFSVVAQYSGSLAGLISQKRKIAELDIDLPTFYRKQGSFDELKIKGIGKKTKTTLELILERGVEEAKRIVGEEKTGKMQSEQFSKIPSTVRKSVRDISPSWDDAVKRYEE